MTKDDVIKRFHHTSFVMPLVTAGHWPLFSSSTSLPSLVPLLCGILSETFTFYKSTTVLTGTGEAILTR